MITPETQPYFYFPEVDSTMNRARELAPQHSGDGFWVRTDYQRAGRGRRGRRWETNPGDAVLTTCAVRRGGRWDPEDAVPGTLALRAAAAVLTTVTGVVGPEAITVKWPNDVLIRGAKVAGVLLEADPRWFLIGIGINVLTAPGIPDGLRSIALATCISGRPPSSDSIFRTLSSALNDMLAGPGWHSVVNGSLAWRGRCVELIPSAESESPRRVAGSPHPDGRGTVQGIAPDGALLLGTSRGVERVYSGTLRLCADET